MTCAYCLTRFDIPIRSGQRRQYCNTTCRTNAFKLRVMEAADREKDSRSRWRHAR